MQCIDETIFISDSLSTLNSIKNNFKLKDITIKIQNKLEALIKNKQITLWILGQTDIKGNETANQQFKNITNNLEIT